MKPTEESKLRKEYVKKAVEKTDLLDSLANDMNKLFGADTVSRYNPDTEKDLSQGCYSTGFQPIDDLITGETDESGATVPGTGKGFPKGRVVEVFGPESAGKSSMALMVVADCQNKGGVAAYIDAEHALDFDYAASLGVKVADMLVCQPDAGEDALELIKQLIKRKVDVIVLDSVAALVPRKELEAAEGDKVQPGTQARMMSQALKRITVLLKKGGPLVVFINQIRYKIGVMFGNPEVTSGGNALKFYSSVRCDLRIVKRIKDGPRTVGVCIRARTVKNKVASPFRETFYFIIFNKGIVIPSKSEVNALFKKTSEKEGDD